MSHAPAKVTFAKPWLSHGGQLGLLRSRGLVIENEAAAEQFLAHVNYYRFSGYCLAFETQRHEIRDGVTFEQIEAAYNFDLALRDLLTEALEVCEVDFRTAVAVAVAERLGPFGHTDPATFVPDAPPKWEHREWLRRTRKDARRSSEAFVKHYESTYREFPDLPIWTVTEILSFGSLSMMFEYMLRDEQRAVAARYGLQPAVVVSWMHHFVYLRNLCAHHSRVWGRVWHLKPMLPAGKKWSPPLLPGNDRLFVTLLALSWLLSRIPAMAAFASEWRRRVESRIASPPSTPVALDWMGLTENWSEHPIWAEARMPPRHAK